MRRILGPALLAALAVVGPLAAHAFLESADPSVGGSIAEPPSVVRLRFSEPVVPARSDIQVLDGDGKRVDKGDPHGDPESDARVLIVSLEPLDSGAFQVLWRAVSADGHVTSGRFTFHVR